MSNKELIGELEKQALAALNAGDPEKAVKILDAAYELCNDPERCRILYKAMLEAEIGSPQEAENILNL